MEREDAFPRERQFKCSDSSHRSVPENWHRCINQFFPLCIGPPLRYLYAGGAVRDD